MTDAEKYGRRNIAKMKAQLDDLRAAIRSHDPVETEAAWDKCEEWIDFVFSKEGK